MKIVGIILFLFLIESSFAQVGINTTNPQEMLHVNGKVRIDDVAGRTSTSVLGVTSDGTLNKINVAGSLEIHNNTIVASGTGYYSVINIPISTPVSNTFFHDLDLGVDGDYTYKTIFRLVGQTQKFHITGIKGGVEGRHIIILNGVNTNMNIVNNSNQSLSENRIFAYGSSTSTAGQGAVELVYDGAQWVILSLRN